MQNEPKYTLANFSAEEGPKVLAEIDQVLEKYDGQFVCLPTIEKNGTLGAKVEIFKKVELVPKEIISPYTDEQTTDTETEEGSDSSDSKSAE